MSDDTTTKPPEDEKLPKPPEGGTAEQPLPGPEQKPVRKVVNISEKQAPPEDKLVGMLVMQHTGKMIFRVPPENQAIFDIAVQDYVKQKRPQWVSQHVQGIMEVLGL